MAVLRVYPGLSTVKKVKKEFPGFVPEARKPKLKLQTFVEIQIKQKQPYNQPCSTACLVVYPICPDSLIIVFKEHHHPQAQDSLTKDSPDEDDG